jgi:hypothetical protein
MKKQKQSKLPLQFATQDLRILKRQLSTMTIRDIEFLESALMVAKDNSKLQEHQYEIDEKLLELRKRKNKNYDPVKLIKNFVSGN